MPRAVLGKGFAEGFWSFAEGQRPSAKHASPVVYAPCSKIAIAYIHACMGRTAYVGVNVLKVTMS